MARVYVNTTTDFGGFTPSLPHGVLHNYVQWVIQDHTVYHTGPVSPLTPQEVEAYVASLLERLLDLNTVPCSLQQLLWEATFIYDNIITHIAHLGHTTQVPLRSYWPPGDASMVVLIT